MAALRDALAEVVVEDFEEAFTKRLPLPRTLHGSKIWPIVFSQGSWFFFWSATLPLWPRCVGAWRVGKAMVDGVDLLGDSII